MQSLDLPSRYGLQLILCCVTCRFGVISLSLITNMCLSLDCLRKFFQCDVVSDSGVSHVELGSVLPFVEYKILV